MLNAERVLRLQRSYLRVEAAHRCRRAILQFRSSAPSAARIAVTGQIYHAGRAANCDVRRRRGSCATRYFSGPSIELATAGDVRTSDGGAQTGWAASYCTGAGGCGRGTATGVGAAGSGRWGVASPALDAGAVAEGACGEPSEKQKRCCGVKQHAIVGEGALRTSQLEKAAVKTCMASRWRKGMSEDMFRRESHTHARR
jgi:hypothetical protein